MDHLHVIQDTLQELLNQIGIPDEIISDVSFDAENNLYNISLQTSNPALLIGYHGENLSAMQLMLGQHLHSSLNEWINLSLNVNDYRERRTTALHSLADTAVSRVLATGQAHSLPPMPASERRIIHLYLAGHPQIVTSSEGQGRSRGIIVSPRSS